MNQIRPFVPYTLARDWGEEIVTAHTPQYMTKVLKYQAGKAGGLQLHREKIESFYLLSGRAVVESDNGHGILVRQEMTPGMAFDIPSGAAHRFIALDDCLVIEGSTPVENDRVRLESVYGVDVIGDGPGLPTTFGKAHE